MTISSDNTEPLDSNSEYSQKAIKKRIVKEFLDIIILLELKQHGSLSGYDLAGTENEKFMLTLSPGTVYAALYSLERKGFVKGDSEGKKTTYCLTPKAEVALATFRSSSKELTEFIKQVFSLN
jgi:DNA-binding PadR family transcriptional regulator